MPSTQYIALLLPANLGMPPPVLAINAATFSAAEGFDVFQKIRSFDGSDMHLNNAPWLSKLFGSGRRGGSRAMVEFYRPASICSSGDGASEAMFLTVSETKVRNGRPVSDHLIMPLGERLSFILHALPSGAGVVLPAGIVAGAASGDFYQKPYLNSRLWDLAAPFLAAEEEARAISRESPMPQPMALIATHRL